VTTPRFPAFRYLGVGGPRGSAERLDAQSLPGRTLRAAAGDTEVALRVAPEPDLTVAQDDDGSFVLVDGRLVGSGDPARRALDAFRRSGVSGVARLDGTAATTVWDAPAGRLWLLRHRTGIPPVFHASLRESRWWAPDIASLLGVGVPRELDPVALDCYLACGYLFAPLTMLATVRKVPPGYALRIDATGTELVLTEPLPWGTVGPLPAQERVERIGRLLEAAVGERLDPAGTTAVLLSGGIDSGLLLAVARVVHGADVAAFTFRYDGYEGPMNEGSRARPLASHLGVPFEEIVIGPEWLATQLDDLVAAYEEPFSYGVHSARLAPLATAGIRVALSGVCTDGWYLTAKERRGFALHRGPLRPVLRAITAGAPRRGVTRRARTLARLAAAPLGDVFYDAAPNTILRDAVRLELYRDPDAAVRGRAAAVGLLAAALDEVPGASRADAYAHLAARFDWPEHLLWWNHRWGRAAAVAVRSPFVDAELAGFFAASPRPGPAKEELRRYAARLVGPELAERPKFPQRLPLSVWLRGPLRGILAERLTADALAATPFRPEVVARALEEHDAGADRTWLLWTVLLVVTWQRILSSPAARRERPR